MSSVTIVCSKGESTIMTRNELKLMLLDEVDEIIYVVDFDNHKLIYVNKTILNMVDLPENEALKLPCYKVLYGFDEPCANCNNEEVLRKGRTENERYSKKFDKYLYQKCRMIKAGGKDAKLCVFTDITHAKRTEEKLENEQRVEATLLECLRMLYENDDIEAALNQCLSNMAEYYNADRAYIFEFAKDNKTINNTYEWCRDGIEAQIDFLQNVDISVISRWMELFETKGEVFISQVSSELDKESLEYEILEQQQIETLMAIPFRKNEKIIGFIGLDNPKQNMERNFLIKIVASVVLNDIEKRHSLEKLYELSFCDRLTKVGNRHAYVNFMNRIEGRKDLSLGIIFADINGLKNVNDKFGHEQGDKMIKAVAEILKKNFGKHIYRIGGDEFVVFCKGVGQREFDCYVKKLKADWTKDISASVGSLWLPKCENIEVSVANTDKLMYQDKKDYYVSKGLYVL